MKKWIIICLFILFTLVACVNDSNDKNTELSNKIISAVDKLFAEAQDLGANVPGIVVGVWNEQTGFEFIYTVGKADLVTKEEMTAAHSFKIASVTKTMVTTVICQLIDEDLLTFDTPLARFFPDLPEADRITIEMLGNMTSGYFDYLDDEEFLDNFDNVPNFTATPEEIVQVGISHPLEYSPGTGFNYSNTNTVLLGMIIEKITGNSLETELNNRLFSPLGLTRTGAPASGSFLPEPKAHSYHPKTREDWTDKMDYSPEYACGNAYSTLMELKIWIEALAKGSMINPATHQQRLAKGSTFTGAEAYTYHFGILEYRQMLGHAGDTDYYLTEAFYEPNTGQTVVILCNTSATGFTTSLFHDIAEIILPQ